MGGSQQQDNGKLENSPNGSVIMKRGEKNAAELEKHQRGASMGRGVGRLSGKGRRVKISREK